MSKGAEMKKKNTFFGMLDSLAFLPSASVEVGMELLKKATPKGPVDYFDSTSGSISRVQ